MRIRVVKRVEFDTLQGGMVRADDGGLGVNREMLFEAMKVRERILDSEYEI